MSLAPAGRPLDRVADRPLDVVLLQVRYPWHERAELQERECFADRCGALPVRWRAVNLVAAPDVGLDTVEGADAVMIGGAGSHTVTERYPFSEPLAELIRALVAEGRPLFGSCYGHQAIALALGGRVATDPAREEVGTFEIELTAEGRRDPLLAGMPGRFAVHLGHHDVVVELPPGMVELARSAVCPNQVVRVAGKPVYGTQFHCEMTREQMVLRLGMYRAEYLPGSDLESELERRLGATPDAESLLCRFLETFAALEARPVVA